MRKLRPMKTTPIMIMGQLISQEMLMDLSIVRRATKSSSKTISSRLSHQARDQLIMTRLPNKNTKCMKRLS